MYLLLLSRRLAVNSGFCDDDVVDDIILKDMQVVTSASERDNRVFYCIQYSGIYVCRIGTNIYCVLYQFLGIFMVCGHVVMWSFYMTEE